MTTPRSIPLPENEKRRQLALRRFHILDTPREQSFDDLAQLAKLSCNAPMALITLIDEDRQWFKSCLGMEGTETPRDLAFCAHAILRPENLLVVEDTHLDVRFSDHPAVTGEPYIRFYAGAPLITNEGDALGTLCVVDTEPRQLSQYQADTLKLLARQVMQLLQLRATNELVRQYAENFRSLSDSVPVLIGQLDKDGRYVFCNRKYHEWFGVEVTDLLGKTQLEAIGGDYVARTSELLQRCFEGEASHFEEALPNGQILGVDYVPQRDYSQGAKGTVVGVFIIATDITEQKQQRLALENERAKLQEREERLQTMISNFPGAVYRCENNARWTMLYLSAAVGQLTGYAAERFLNDSLSLTDITHPDDVTPVFEQVQEALVRKSPFHMIYRIQHVDGTWLWVEEVGCGVYDAAGELKYIDGFIWDITIEEEARKAILLSEQRLSTLYNQAPVAIILNDFANGRFIDCNPEFVRMIGYSTEEILSLRYMDLTPPEYAESDNRELQNLLRTGRYGPYEKQYIHKDGHLIPILLNGVLIETPSGEQHIWAFIQDITERKRIEQMKNEFVSAVSHELRTPLTSISGSLGLIVNGMLGELPFNINNMLSIAHKNAQRLTILINDLLDMEKLLAGKMTFELRVQPLLPIIEQSLEGNKAYADTFGVRLELCSSLGGMLVNIDAQRLQQVLANFISNAVKFSPVNGAVEIHVERRGERVEIAVIDHGPGVSDDFRARIFQKFAQADSSDSRRRGGTGLGLAISKALVERMSGTIGFVSELGKGATFFASFPLVDMDALKH